MTKLEILITARKLIEKPENWIQGRFTDFQNSYCAEGAICFAAAGEARWFALDNRQDVDDLIFGLRDSIGQPVSKFNDSHTHPEVLAMFDKAIEAEKATEHEIVK